MRDLEDLLNSVERSLADRAGKGASVPVTTRSRIRRRRFARHAGEAGVGAAACVAVGSAVWLGMRTTGPAPAVTPTVTSTPTTTPSATPTPSVTPTPTPTPTPTETADPGEPVGFRPVGTTTADVLAASRRGWTLTATTEGYVTQGEMSGVTIVVLSLVETNGTRHPVVEAPYLPFVRPLSWKAGARTALVALSENPDARDDDRTESNMRTGADGRSYAWLDLVTGVAEPLTSVPAQATFVGTAGDGATVWHLPPSGGQDGELFRLSTKGVRTSLGSTATSPVVPDLDPTGASAVVGVAGGVVVVDVRTGARSAVVPAPVTSADSTCWTAGWAGPGEPVLGCKWGGAGVYSARLYAVDPRRGPDAVRALGVLDSYGATYLAERLTPVGDGRLMGTGASDLSFGCAMRGGTPVLVDAASGTVAPGPWQGHTQFLGFQVVDGAAYMEWDARCVFGPVNPPSRMPQLVRVDLASGAVAVLVDEAERGLDAFVVAR